jgi:hypothetical protein
VQRKFAWLHRQPRQLGRDEVVPPPPRAKVFCFFFSKKKRFLLLATLFIAERVGGFALLGHLYVF